MDSEKIDDYIEFVKKTKSTIENLIDIYDECFFTWSKEELNEKLEQCNRILDKWI